MLIHWIWLATRPGLSDRQKVAVLESLGDPETVYFAEEERFGDIDGLSEEAKQGLCDRSLTAAQQILQVCMDKGIRICTMQDAAYPVSLKHIPDPPLVLYYKGQFPDFSGTPTIGVVGTRKASSYGLTVAKRMGFQIARCGGIVVSGAASGIDAEAMRGALTAGGCVVAILGCGADVVYPAANKSLYADTEHFGCLISEFVPGTPPLKWNFPKRNRLISGISNGVLIVEAPHKSGALITARQAADQGRDVFVVPGNIDNETCQGSNALLREGAISVSSGWDVVSEYSALYPGKIRMDNRPVRMTPQTDEVMSKALETENPVPKVAQNSHTAPKKRGSGGSKEEMPIDNGQKRGYSDQSRTLGLSEQEQQILAAIREECLVDDVISETGLPAAMVLAALTMLQIKGVIRSLPGKRVAKI